MSSLDGTDDDDEEQAGMEIVRAALKLDSSSASFTHCRYVILKCLAYFLHSPFYGPIFRTVYCPTYDGVTRFFGDASVPSVFRANSEF